MIDPDSPEFKIGQFIGGIIRKAIFGAAFPIARYFIGKSRNSNRPSPGNPSFNK